MNIPKLLQQAGAYLNDGDPNSADMVLHRILKKQPKHVDALNLSGVAAYHRKDFKRAGYLLKKVISQDPHRASAHLNLGAVFNSSNAFGEAEQHYFTTLRLEPENAVAMCNLGKNFLDQNKYSEARKWLESSVINDSQYWVASHNLATCLQRMGETDRAIETYRRTLNIFDNPLSLSELIVSLRRTDRFAEEYLLAKRLLGMPDAADLAISAWETHQNALSIAIVLGQNPYPRCLAQAARSVCERAHRRHFVSVIFRGIFASIRWVISVGI